MATILVCDGDPRQQQRLQVKLQQHGHEVRLARQFEQVHEVLQDVVINLLVMDLDRQNLDLLSQSGDCWHGIKILCQTNDPELKHDFRTWIADALVSKGGDEEQMACAIDQLLASRSPKTGHFNKSRRKCGEN